MVNVCFAYDCFSFSSFSSTKTLLYTVGGTGSLVAWITWVLGFVGWWVARIALVHKILTLVKKMAWVAW